MPPAPTKLLESYELVAAPMTLDDVPKLHELSIGVGWPHRPEDWALVIGLGEGIVARDEIGRVIGSAMWFPLGDEFAAIGMVITSPRLQENGAGRWLMGHILNTVGARGKVLNATRPAYRLYISLGFMPLSPVYQHNGIVGAVAPGPRHARPMTAQDVAAIHGLDSIAMGIARPDVLDRLLPLSTGTVVERDGRVTGFALCRKFGRGHVVGPIVAESEEDAIALVAPHAEAMEGSFLRVDTRQPDGPFRQFLIGSGIRHYDTVTRMGLGPVPQATGPAFTFGLVNQALG
ncbi:Acetyltransferase (GNAT) domain-containing protein [Gemmobacter aquatilis]|uniref:Acetyltransferase (GNAT) domain-containing protein n=1 Tax=Gemmobacter aquatilis TaxID=933059 RepID=A0A1H8IE49_9RHOB|nr:GNAT family N-acetyltransferase [Gemmobacter aquatilis]SEN66522.1 Acetyltransferase (GNAT) domain-containing protein [Gemmobacter aquatilis]